MRFLTAIFLFAVMSVSPVWSADDSTPPATEKSDAQKDMDALAQAGIRQALEAIAKSGGMYPFGLISVDGNLQVVGYSGAKEEAPDPEDWAKGLFMKLRQIGNEQPEVNMMSIYRLHEIENDEGEKVVGVWAEVDHREVRPWVIFIPLLENEDGKHEIGEAIYYATDQPLFEKRGE
ncbi:hypothetical protein D4A39_13085 [Alcanivorax profundi]|uniref:Uncharacterized protein n=1 Tax=Alcanivorax profundi TaxID=2338368 RepID=A0A418XVL0_9GAMM|nr:hypothetical protein [Alcanivorax profundi]RJG16753.1 hypothetical protein D4A39_13085 [Alcanivorax profundi]